MTASGIGRGSSVSCHLLLSFPPEKEGSLFCTCSWPVLLCCAHGAISADKDLTRARVRVHTHTHCNINYDFTVSSLVF